MWEEEEHLLLFFGIEWCTCMAFYDTSYEALYDVLASFWVAC